MLAGEDGFAAVAGSAAFGVLAGAAVAGATDEAPRAARASDSGASPSSGKSVDSSGGISGASAAFRAAGNSLAPAGPPDLCTMALNPFWPSAVYSTVRTLPSGSTRPY